MIDQFLTYELKVAVLIAVFYIFWRLLVANETWHRLNRIVLIATAIASFVLPLCVITIHQTVEVMPPAEIPTVVEDFNSATHESGISNSIQQVPVITEPQKAFNWQQVLMLIYIIGVVLLVARMLISIWRLHRMMAHSELHPLTHGRWIAVCDKVQQPFSWWNTVFMNRKDFEEGATALLTHELGHIRLHHSADVVLVELLTALQWFNPTMWMLRADLHTIHEYEADQQVLSHGFNDIQYLTLLIRKAAHQSGYSLANGIANQSTLKKRITMIMKPQSNRWQWLRLAYLLPIVGVTIALNAETVTNMVYKNDEPQKQVPVKKGKRNATIKTNANQGIQVIEVIEAPEAADNEKTYESTEDPTKMILDAIKNGSYPIVILDGKLATREQVLALDDNEINQIDVVKDVKTIEEFSRELGRDAKNGIIAITTNKQKDKYREQATESPDVFDRAEEMPQFPGGHIELLKFLNSNIQYPEEAKEAGIQGRVIVSFIVEKDGTISGTKVTKHVNPLLDEEALRMVNAMPKWTPGKVNGKPENIRYSVPINFRLDNVVTPKAEVNGLSMHVDGNNPKSTLMGTVKQVKIDNQDALNADIEIDGKKASIEELSLIQHSDIESMQIFEKDDQHPNVRLIITTKKK